MAKKQNTDLKIGAIRKKAKEVNEWDTYELEEGVTLKFQPLFSDTKIVEMLENYQKLLKQAKEKELTLSDKNTYFLLLLQCIKQFTHLGKDMKLDIDYQLDFLEAMTDSGYFKLITEEVFLPGQLKKVYDKVSDVLGADHAMDYIQNKAQEKFENIKLKNQTAFNVLADKMESKVVN
jgi:hypothetical protein